MAADIPPERKFVFSFGTGNTTSPPGPERLPPRPDRTPAAGKVGPGPVRPRKRRAAGLPANDDAITIKVDSTPSPRSDISKEDREKARGVLDDIGKRFASNRLKGKFTAYEEYQRDLAQNSHFLVAGGLMSLKELSELFMRLEEFRKSTAEQGKTPATLLGEWLRGESVPGV
jgi:hypothetical protein